MVELRGLEPLTPTLPAVRQSDFMSARATQDHLIPVITGFVSSRITRCPALPRSRRCHLAVMILNLVGATRRSGSRAVARMPYPLPILIPLRRSVRGLAQNVATVGHEGSVRAGPDTGDADAPPSVDVTLDATNWS